MKCLLETLPLRPCVLNSCRSDTTAPIDYRPQSSLRVSILKVFAVIHDTQRYPPFSQSSNSGAATAHLNLDYA